MIANTTNVKNLAIALEAVSQINNEGSADLYVRVEDLLKDALKNLETQTPRHKHPNTQLDDEIPF